MSDRKYYVLHLPEDQVTSPGNKFEIQLVDSLGVTVAFGLISKADSHLELEGEIVPMPVIDAAKKLPIGTGDFVDAAGSSVHPKNL